MRYALDALDITVVVTDEKVEIKASVPLEFSAVEKKWHFMLTGHKRRHKSQPIDILSLAASL
jgi:hypothetical protein